MSGLTTKRADVLVIGGAIAGCMAAAEAVKHGLKVILVDKGMMGRSGSSPTAGTATAAAFSHSDLGRDLPEPDSPQLHFLDTYKAGDGLCDPRLVALCVEEALPIVRELETFGVPWTKTADGRYFQYKALGHSRSRSCHPTGSSMTFMAAIAKEVFYRRAEVVEDTMVTDLLMADGRVVGALGFHRLTGEEVLFQAGAVVLAAGSATRLFKYASANFQTTGDAQALGFRVGAPLVNMEFVEFTVIPKVAQKIISTGGISPFTGRGSHIRNALGERIMETYDPVRLERTTRAQLVRAIDREIREGRGPIWNDSSHFTEELWQEFHTSSPEVLDRLKAAGLEYRRAPFEWVPAMHTCLGGFLIDEHGETAVPGLYASGECAATIHGANRLSGNATTECLVFGKRAGRHAALFARRNGSPPVPPRELTRARGRLAGRRGETGEDPFAVERELRELSWRHFGVIRSEDLLGRGLEKLRDLERTSLRGRGVKEVVKGLEVANMLLVGRLITRAALTRTESRGQHYREDFPAKAPEWQRWVLLRQRDDGIEVGVQEIPGPEGQAAAWLGA